MRGTTYLINHLRYGSHIIVFFFRIEQRKMKRSFPEPPIANLDVQRMCKQGRLEQ